MKVNLIRHGKTMANVKRLYCGQTDVPLCEEGIAELLELKKEILYPSGEQHFFSGMKRTAETLRILYGVEGNVLEYLKEIHFGSFEMKSYEELKSTSAFQEWITNFETQSPPEGESKKIFEDRVIRGYQELLDVVKECGQKNVVIVSHGGVIATIMEQEFPNQKNFYEWQPSHGRGYQITYEGEKRDEGNISHKFWNII